MTMLLLRFVHIVGGAVWVGFIVFTTFYLFPVLRESGAASGPFMQGFQKRGLTTVMPLLAFLTIASGIALLWIVSNGFSPVYMRSRMGSAISFGGGCAIVSVALGMGVMRPAVMRAAAIGQGMASVTSEPERAQRAAEMHRYQTRAATVGVLVAVFVLLAVAAMSVARYL